MWGELGKFVALGVADQVAIPAAGAYSAYKGGQAVFKHLKRTYMSDREALTPFKLARRERIDKRKRERSYKMPKYSGRGYGGHYTGKLRAVSKARRPTPYDKYGYSQEVERFGVQSLDNVCYLGATSFCMKDLGPVIGVAFLRKLMKRHYGIEYTHPDQNVTQDAGVAGVGPTSIQFYYEEITAANAEPVIAQGWIHQFYNPATGVYSTVNQFGAQFAVNVLQNTIFGSGATASYPVRRLHGYRFSEVDYTVQNNDPAGAPLQRHTVIQPLKNQYLSCYSCVTLGIQNVTPADNGTGEGVLSTTRVDTNPVKGKLLKFKDLLPILEQRRGAYGATSADNAYKLQIDANADGIIKPDSSLLADWTQIPTSRMFSNCIREGPIRLEPGEIKDYTLMFKFNGTLEKFMRGIGNDTSLVVNPLQKTGFGQSVMFALEKRMPTGGASVTVNFHYESKYGCVFGKRLTVLMQRGAKTGEVNPVVNP